MTQYCTLLLLCAIWNLSHFVDAATKSFYTAAVYEHARFGSENDSFSLIINTNLKFYKKAAEIAASKGADIIVFPEYGLFTYSDDRLKLKPFLEYVPDPRKNHVPCDDPDMYSNRPILSALSCMAKNNGMYVVANMGAILRCYDWEDDNCPGDSDYQYNTNVVFDRSGKLIVRYFKEHLYFELGMDLPKGQQDSTFRTEFGTFATYICFDIVFARMSEVAHLPNVTGIAYSANWIEQSPQWGSIQLWESFARGNNVTLLASNIQLPGLYSVGSGVFKGDSGALAYTYNPDGISKLVVTRVPIGQGVPEDEELLSSVTEITEDASWPSAEDGRNVKKECSWKRFGDATDVYSDYRCTEENIDNFTFVKLQEPSGSAEACHNGLCCSLEYESQNLTANYYLMAYNGTQNYWNRYFWWEENCVLAVCEPFGDKECSVFPKRSDTVFVSFTMRGNFSESAVVSSAVAESGMRLVPEIHTLFGPDSDSSTFTIFDNDEGSRIIVAGMKGRVYERDPLFVR